MWAAKNGHVDVLRAMFATKGKHLLAQHDIIGRSPIDYAVGTNQLAAVDQLVKWADGRHQH